MNNQLYIVITDFNGFSQTRCCLDALRKSYYRNFSVILVDHGTTEETKNAVGKCYPEVIRITGSPDLWWAGATNVGIRYSLGRGAQVVMLLNSDCYVTPETIGELLDIWGGGQKTIIAPVQRDLETGKIHTITPMCMLSIGFPAMSGPKKMAKYSSEMRTIATNIIAGGRGVLIASSAFADIGLLDEESLPHYWADHDFYLRAKKNNWSLCISTKAIVDVDGRRTTIAENLDKMSFGRWIDSLRDFRSHRNIAHVCKLFKKHYPIKRLYFIGVFLYTVRYLILFLFFKVKKLISSCG